MTEYVWEVARATLKEDKFSVRKISPSVCFYSGQLPSIPEERERKVCFHSMNM